VTKNILQPIAAAKSVSGFAAAFEKCDAAPPPPPAAPSSRLQPAPVRQAAPSPPPPVAQAIPVAPDALSVTTWLKVVTEGESLPARLLTPYRRDEVFVPYSTSRCDEELAQPGSFICASVLDWVGPYICAGTQCHWVGSEVMFNICHGSVPKVTSPDFTRGKPLVAFALNLHNRHWILVVVDTAPPVTVEYYDSYQSASHLEKEKRRLLRDFIEKQGEVVRYIVDRSHVSQQNNSCAVATLQHLARRLDRPDWQQYNRRHVAGMLRRVLAQNADARMIIQL
jgi:hypothetical protein